MRGKIKLSKTAADGAVALLFLVLGFQIAFFTGEVFKKRGKSVDIAPPEEKQERQIKADKSEKPDNNHSVSLPAIKKRIEAVKNSPSQVKKSPELFVFNPNTVSTYDLCRLGFTVKQAEVIDNYRSKGGRFKKKRDFAKMYVVSDSTYHALEPYISLPLMNLNTADSTALLELPGIGPYYAHKILKYRERLGGLFDRKEQLLEIERFDEERYKMIEECIEAGNGKRDFTIWNATQKQLEHHPYIGTYAAKGIMRFRETCDSSQWNFDNLVSNGIISSNCADKLKNQ